MGTRLALAVLALMTFALTALAQMPGTELPTEQLLSNGETSSARAARQEKLYQAAFRGKLAEVKELLAARAKPNEPVQGSYALSAACVNGHTEVVRALVGGGANVNVKDSSGRTPLMLSLRYPKIVELLVQKGAKVDEMNIDGKRQLTALMQAIIDGNTEVAMFLLQNGADPTVAGKIGASEVTARGLAKERKDRPLLRLIGDVIKKREPASTAPASE